MNNPFGGIIVPAVTPYKDDLSLDIAGVERVLSHFDNHTDLDGLFITGATGEYDVLTMAERKTVLDIALDMNLKKNWVPNTTTLERASSLELTEYAVSRGISTIGVILPKECRSFAHVQAFLRDIRSLGTSIFIYQTGNSPYPLSLPEFGQLLDEGHIIGMKDSCSAKDMTRHIGYISEYGHRISVIQGVEMLYLSSLVMGSKGVIGGGCNVYPQLLRQIQEAFAAGRIEDAAALQGRVNRLVDILYAEGTGNESMKYFLSLCGVPIGWASRKTTIPVSDRKKTLMKEIYNQLYK